MVNDDCYNVTRMKWVIENLDVTWQGNNRRAWYKRLPWNRVCLKPWWNSEFYMTRHTITNLSLISINSHYLSSGHLDKFLIYVVLPGQVSDICNSKMRLRFHDRTTSLIDGKDQEDIWSCDHLILQDDTFNMLFSNGYNTVLGFLLHVC